MQEKKYKIFTKSKDNYLHCLDIINKHNFKIEKKTGDTWRCAFEIVFIADNLPNEFYTYEMRMMIKITTMNLEE